MIRRLILTAAATPLLVDGLLMLAVVAVGVAAAWLIDRPG